MLLYKNTLSGARRLAGVTDGGINVLPSFEQKKQIIENAKLVMHALGLQHPRIALMSATEAVPSTVDAKTLTKIAAPGELGECEVYGPRRWTMPCWNLPRKQRESRLRSPDTPT